MIPVILFTLKCRSSIWGSLPFIGDVFVRRDLYLKSLSLTQIDCTIFIHCIRKFWVVPFKLYVKGIFVKLRFFYVKKELPFNWYVFSDIRSDTDLRSFPQVVLTTVWKRSFLKNVTRLFEEYSYILKRWGESYGRISIEGQRGFSN